MPITYNVSASELTLQTSAHEHGNFAELLDALPTQQKQTAQILLDMGVKASHVHIALQRAAATGESLPPIMRDFGFLSAEQVAEAISRQTGFPFFSSQQIDDIDAEDLKDIDLTEFRRFVPVGRDEAGFLLLAVPDEGSINAAKNEFFKEKTKILIAAESTITTIFRRFYAKTEQKFDATVNRFEKAMLGGRRGSEDDESASIVREVFGALLRHACYSGASDLYLFKSEAVGVIKLKINGSGQIFRVISTQLYDRLLNKLATENCKVEDLRREPKESTIEFSDDDREKYEDIINRFGFRLELTESRGVRGAVVRLLDKQANATELDRLGFDEKTMANIKKIAATSTGLMLVTGPTGSGKTTSLYAVLKHIDPVERSVQSVEDPIEYRHGLWQQYELRKDATEKGKEYNNWLKALLRLAPDVILIGEVRDSEVANIMLDASNTGHLTFATLHTNNATMALARLKRLGVDLDTLASVLLGILAQRLVRVLCPRCKEDDNRDETARTLEAGYLGSYVKAPKIQGAGCKFCDFTGFRGRRMVYELLHMNSHVRDLIESDSPPSQIARAGIEHGTSMWACGLRLVAQGFTSLDELERVATRDDDEPESGK